ncbi:hypothetical protein [Paenibacillus sp. DMB20]|uniref:hypothetical protein n=1 Tax=Paenibacillus sp. DMB20 TaxID=1642570 RepID=UPI000627AEB2|nr:hypothetical protein [Paenibacillus sp. DMB20]KKO55252.1 hypothetical protein XI25_01950 [Paenibacillus sp. DMB20]
MNELQQAPIWILVAASVLVLSQGSWLFMNARKRGLGKMAWFWGIWGSTTVPLPLILYWVIVIRPKREKPKT